MDKSGHSIWFNLAIIPWGAIAGLTLFEIARATVTSGVYGAAIKSRAGKQLCGLLIPLVLAITAAFVLPLVVPSGIWERRAFIGAMSFLLFSRCWWYGFRESRAIGIASGLGLAPEVRSRIEAEELARTVRSSHKNSEND